jgi:hypothetical protein
MPGKDTRELIQRELDGVLSEQERQELARLLEGDAEARRIRSDMQGLALTLNRVKEEDPPPSLKPAVMRAVEELEGRRARAGAPRRALSRLKLPRVRFAFAAGLAAGIVLFAGIEAITPGLLVEEVGVRGTLAPEPPRTGEIPNLVLHAGSAECAVTFLPAGGDPTLLVRLETPEAAAVELTWTDELQAVGVSRISGNAGEYEVRPGRVRIAAGGSSSVEVRFAGRAAVGAELSVRLAGPGGVESAGRFDITAPPHP